MKSFYLTDTGRVRSHNEDYVTIVKNASGEFKMNLQPMAWEDTEQVR